MMCMFNKYVQPYFLSSVSFWTRGPSGLQTGHTVTLGWTEKENKESVLIDSVRLGVKISLF